MRSVCQLTTLVLLGGDTLRIIDDVGGLDPLYVRQGAPALAADPPSLTQVAPVVS
jgi:hypothetical protein